MGLALSAPLVLPMVADLFGKHWMLPAVWQFLLATPVQFILGARFYKAAWGAVKNFSGTGDSNNNTMYTTHALLDTLFNGGADTVDTTVTAGVDDARTFLSGGRTFVLPTQAELVALSNTIPTTGWYNARYWSSTLSSANNHTSVGIAGDWVYTSADSTPEMLVLQVLPVVIDLNRDGILSYGQVTMDVNGDGHLDTTKWAGAQDGVLVWDRFADGLVHDTDACHAAFNLQRDVPTRRASVLLGGGELAAALSIANVGTTCAEFAGVAAGMELFGLSRYLSVPLAAALVTLLVLAANGDVAKLA